MGAYHQINTTASKGMTASSNRQPHPDVFIKGKGPVPGQPMMQQQMMSRQMQVQSGLTQQPKATHSQQNLMTSSYANQQQQPQHQILSASSSNN